MMKFSLKIRQFFVLLTVVAFMPLVLQATANQLQAEKILQKYNQKSGVQIKLEMLTEKKVLGTKTKEAGVMTHRSGKLNIALQGEKKSEMIFDGNKAYVISYPDQELDPDGKRKVFLVKANSKNQMNILSNLFGNPKKFFEGFKVKTVSNDKNNLTLKLEDKANVLKPMILVFSKETETLKQLSYLDDVGSEIQINFENPNFTTEISAKLFKYNALKSDEVVSQ
jgi:outer membrane lipoprotein-sorting protein